MLRSRVGEGIGRFGQDALVTDVPRNATVTMTTSGTLMRLSEPDFESLLMHPVIEKLDLDKANVAHDRAIKVGDTSAASIGSLTVSGLNMAGSTIKVWGH